MITFDYEETPLELVFIIKRNQDQRIYKDIKRTFDIRYGVGSQMIQMKSNEAMSGTSY